MIGSDVRIEGVNKSFGDFSVLKDINLTIRQGEFFSLLGPSGCGKTTLLRLCAGLLRPAGGTVRFSIGGLFNRATFNRGIFNRTTFKRAIFG